MDLVDGITLADWRRAHEQPAVADVVFLVKQIASGLDAIHAAGMIHRDIKPANVLVDRAGHVTILDLGLASRLSSTGWFDDGSGTPNYMAPEQTVSRPISSELAFRSDIYQLGVTTFELLVGDVPFDGERVTAVFARHREESPPPPSSSRPDLLAAVDTAVLTALEKDPADRYSSASGFAAALAAAATRPPSILVAEDEPGALSATCALLAAGLPPGSRVEGVSDGEAALELAKREHFDALVLDLHMPKLGGLDVVERLETMTNTRPYTIVVTAMGGANDWRDLRARGVGGILLKPFDGDDLVSMVRRHIAVAG
jgi:serine/threonine-protein kinase